MNSVIVVGAGLAGLSCAWKLRRSGHEVEVLEARSRPGGRTQSEIREGFTLESGSRKLIEIRESSYPEVRYRRPLPAPTNRPRA